MNKKFTDEEIVRAAHCCTKNNCKTCPFIVLGAGFKNCVIKFSEYIANNTKNEPAPAATETSANDNTEAVITNDNDTTNCRACQVGLSMSAGGGKSAMYAKCCEEIAEIVLRLYKKMGEEDQDTFLLGEIYGRAMAAQEEEEE